MVGELVLKLGCFLQPSIFAKQNLKITTLAELTVKKARKGHQLLRGKGEKTELFGLRCSEDCVKFNPLFL